MPFELPDLPYDADALAPHVSAETLAVHHGKHHKAYVDKLNGLVEDGPFADRDLDAIIRATAGDADNVAIFNNAAQAWNHGFYWHSMKPGGGGAPGGELGRRLERDFGGYEAFAEAFTAAATGQFGSGWAWLVQDRDGLKVVSTGNAETPLTTAATPLLTLDVWEHAYYLDYQNRRPDYVATFLAELANWDFAAANLR